MEARCTAATRPTPWAWAARDTELVQLARGAARIRLRLGELLDALFRVRGHHELGFSSLEAYGLERCGRTGRWCGDTRRLAARIRKRGLARIRGALRLGRLSWSAAELLARVATAKTEAELLERAEGRTVREVKRQLGAGPADVDDDEPVAATRAVGPAERLMVEATRQAVEHIVGHRVGSEAFLTALLGEAETTLLGLGARPIEEILVAELDPEAVRALRRGAPASSSSTARLPPPPALAEVPPDPPLPRDVRGLDAEIRRCARELAARDLRIGELARTLFLGRGWRALGYDSRAQYAKDRVGMSPSGLEHRATLARRAVRAPALRDAVASGEMGYEAALLVSRLPGLGPALTAAWVARARRRTVLHLREEVNAVLLRHSLDRRASCAPPGDEALEEIAALERKVQSGELFSSLLGAVGLKGPQMSVTVPAGAGCGLTFKVSAELKAHFDAVEAEFRRLAGPRASFVAFMCVCVWSSWLPWLEARDDRWRHVFSRDRHRCTNPVCDRTDVTPHHLRFRAYGGGDDDENMTSLCWWCHLEGVHGGRITAEPPASGIRWRLGRTPVLEVHGREVVARAP